MKIDNNLLSIDQGEPFNFRFDASPNAHPSAQAPERYLILHATEGASVRGAVSTFKTKGGLSIHLILGKDGKEIVQMLSLDKGGKHAADHNNKSIGIELDYPGDLRESGSKYQLRSEYKENEYIQAWALNDSRFRYWPLYPQAQLDALLTISKTLLNSYNIKDVVGHEELYSYKLDPGPAFPILQFREKLLGVTGRSLVLQETARTVRVRNQPGENFVFLSETRIPAGTPVSVINELDRWCLISVMKEVEGNPWIMGWVEKRAVRVKTDQPIVISPDNYLSTPEGRSFQVIEPHPRNYDRKHPLIDPKYVVIHFTTGTRLQSTIAHFRNELSGVCTHLLVGRDGRVIQFLPFDKIAYHAGYSWWEGDRSLNTYSIGIELDNAGFLKKSNGNWVRKDTIIPEKGVKLDTHWRESRERGWERFTKPQLAVTLEIVRALKERYGSIVEILGHDDVNLRERLDPGPLFPMERFRRKIFGRKKPLTAKFEIDREAHLYMNDEGRLPNANQQAQNDLLPLGSTVKVLRNAGNWTLVDVIQSSERSLRKTTGWIRSNSLTFAQIKGSVGRKKQGKNKKQQDKKKKGKKNEHKPVVVRGTTKVRQEIFRKGDSPPTPKLRVGPFPAGTKVRIQEKRGNWTLVALLEPFRGLKGLEGWVDSRFVKPLE
jgi:N-acetylmuramoyl-L-alanine amidase